MDFGALKCDSETTASSSSIKQNLVRILPISFQTHEVFKESNNLVIHSKHTHAFAFPQHPVGLIIGNTVNVSYDTNLKILLNSE